MLHAPASALTTANTQHTQPENRVHYPALDGLRAVALCMVFCQHYLAMPWGYTGVDLFFVLSGFLITGILYDTVDRPDRVRSFFIRRSLRIFPLYYGLLFALFALTPVMHFHWSRYWLVWPAYLGNIIRFVRPYSTDPVYLSAANGWLRFGTHSRALNLGHFWSLCLEEQFYLAWPWIVFFVRDRRPLVWICAGVVLIMPFVRVITMALLPVRYTELELPYSFTPLRLDALLIGGLLALLIRGSHRQLVLKLCRWLLTVMASLVAIYLFLTIHPGQPYVYHPWRLTWGQSLLDLLYMAVIATALTPGNLIYAVCNLRGLRRIGQISYGAYVFHDIPHAFYTLLLQKAAVHIPLLQRHLEIGVFAVAWTGTMLLASLSYRFFESPILNLKERWAPSSSGALRIRTPT